MKLIPSDHLKAHLLEQNVVMPEGGFDIPDGEYDSTAAELAQSPMHRHESEEAFADRVNYALIWKLYGQQQNGNQRGVDLVNAQRMEVMTRSLTKMQDSSLPDIAQKVSAAVEAGSNLVSWSVKEHRDSTEARSAELVTAVSSFQTFNGANHAEVMKVTGERHTDLMEIFGKLLLLGKWILGVLIAGFLFLAAIGIITGILGIHAHAQIDIIRFQDNAGLPVGTVAAPFVIKAGSNCSLAKSGPTVTFNCTGGAGGSMTWPAAAGIAVYAGASAWGTSLTAPSGTIVGTSDTQVLTNKDLTGVGNTFPTFNQNTTGSAAKWTTARNLAGNSVDGSGNVAFANKFIAQGTADSGLSGAQFLGALATCVLKNTTTTGVLSCAVGSDIPNIAESQVTNLTTDLAARASSTAATTVNGVSCALSSTCTVADSTKVPTTTTVNGHALSANVTVTASDVSLGSVTNDAQTKNSIVPNSFAGLRFGNSGTIDTAATSAQVQTVIGAGVYDASGAAAARVGSVSGTANELSSTGGTTPVLSIASTFDIHSKTSTAPIKAGTTAAAPATCQANIELYIETDATEGQQVFICNGTGNGWNLVGDGGGAGGGVNDPGANGVMVRTALNTTTARTLTGTANQITVTNGDGVAATPTFSIASPATMPGEITLAAPTTGAASLNFPSGTAPTTPSAGDIWLDTNEIHMVVQAATQGVVNLYNGAGTFTNGLTSAPSANRTSTFPDVTGTVGIIVVSGTSTFTTTAVAASACQTTVTTAATGALSTDNFIWSYASAPTAATDGRLTIQPYVTANNVNFMRCNNTAASVTPTAIVVNWSVVRRP